MIVACNTASAKALRTIQQRDLPHIDPSKRVLGVIRPTSEIIGNYTKTKQVGILATAGTVSSRSYLIEIEKFFPDVKVSQEACPMCVPLVENNEFGNPRCRLLHQKTSRQYSPDLDALLLACTHYPLLIKKIKQFLPSHITVLSQGDCGGQFGRLSEASSGVG